MTQPNSPAFPVEIDLPAARYRLRRLDVRNLILERQHPKGMWVIDQYHPGPASLARALINLAADLPEAEGLALLEAVDRLTAAIDSGVERIEAAISLKGSDLSDPKKESL